MPKQRTSTFKKDTNIVTDDVVFYAHTRARARARSTKHTGSLQLGGFVQAVAWGVVLDHAVTDADTSEALANVCNEHLRLFERREVATARHDRPG